MRRQSKPFVTEYRASGRRSKESTPSLRAERDPRESDASAISFQAMGRLPGGGEEDSYEAAMRAADALFAAPSSGPRSQATQPAAPPSAPLADPTAEAMSSPPVATRAEDDTASTNPHVPPAGRILRAIDEPESDPFAGYPADGVPKRRGRKPGSKNKPKFIIPRSEPAAEDLPGLGEAETAGEPPPTIRAQKPNPETFPRSVAPLLPTRARREPFAWVRTKLRPGEKWKRRLPKVAW